MKPYSFETFPGLNCTQSTLPPLVFHSSPKADSNSTDVRLGGSFLTISFDLEFVDRVEIPAKAIGVRFCVAEAGIDRTPFERIALG